jgi:hypothetical protein
LQEKDQDKLLRNRDHRAFHWRARTLERRRHRMASVPAVSFTRPGGIWKMSVPPAGSSTSVRSRKRANAWQSLQ